MELNFGRKEIFFTVLYRSPTFNHTSAEFANFLSNVTNLYSKIKSENPYGTFFAGDFNAHSKLWWPDGNTTTEGTEIDNLFSYLRLSQVISVPTNFEPNKSPTCNDIVFTDQPNLILDSGTRPSPDSYCHHQITAKLVSAYHRPRHTRERFGTITGPIAPLRRCRTTFPWIQQLNINPDPN